jgi:hypothetical protein
MITPSKVAAIKAPGRLLFLRQPPGVRTLIDASIRAPSKTSITFVRLFAVRVARNGQYQPMHDCHVVAIFSHAGAAVAAGRKRRRAPRMAEG